MAREQRRLAAIVCTDVVGYSRMIGADEAGTLARLRVLRHELVDPGVAAHGGRIVKTTGDGLLIEFGSVVDAMRCAVAMQREMARRDTGVPEDHRITFRIGVHMGDIVIDGDDILGDGVNVAARLEALAEPGGVCVSGRVQEDLAGRIDLDLRDGGEQALKNISRPVRVWRWAPVGSSVLAADTPLTLPDKPSIAVLPFTNMSGDAEQEYFCDGITEDIITELSRFHSLFVIARNSSFIYKGKTVDIKQVGRELGVRYVLEGSIRRAGNRIRLTGQLIDAVTGNHLWAERYDRVLDDVFAIQEELTRSIILEIEPHISAVELAKAKRRRPGSLSAYEMALCANAKLTEAVVTGDWAQHRQALEEARAALAVDATSTLALNTLATAIWSRILWGYDADAEPAWHEGVAAAVRSIELDPNDAFAYAARGMLAFNASDPARRREMLSYVQRGHDLNPNDPWILMYLALGKITVGEAADAVALLQRSQRHSPFDPARFWILFQFARACFALGDYRGGVDYAERGLSERPAFVGAYRILAMSLVGLGEIERAKAALEQAREIAPRFVERGLHGHLGYENAEQHHRALTFLRIAAGFEDPSAAESLR